VVARKVTHNHSSLTKSNASSRSWGSEAQAGVPCEPRHPQSLPMT